MSTFFGISDKYIISVYKQFHNMRYYGGWSLIEAYNLPIGLRNFNANLIIQTLEKEREEAENHK